jgi:threonine dehydratase
MNRERLPADIVLAANRIGPHIRETPLDHSPYFSELTGANVYLKLDNLQHTGSFKLRGAFNKVLSLTPDERKAGCVTASSGSRANVADESGCDSARRRRRPFFWHGWSRH